MDKKKLEKRLTIGFQIFALIGLIIIGYYLGKAYKASKTNEVINDFGTKFEKFYIDSDTKKYSVKVDNKNIDIENKEDGLYLNSKKINNSHAIEGYILDKVLILYDVGQVGSSLTFINKDLEEIPIDNDYKYEKLELVDGKLEGIAVQYEDFMGCRFINDLEICPCDSLDTGDLLKKYKDSFDSIRDNFVSGTIKLSYNGKEITTSYVEKETINDIYGSDLDGTTKTYCVRVNN